MNRINSENNYAQIASGLVQDTRNNQNIRESSKMRGINNGKERIFPNLIGMKSNDKKDNYESHMEKKTRSKISFEEAGE